MKSNRISGIRVDANCVSFGAGAYSRSKAAGFDAAPLTMRRDSSDLFQAIASLTSLGRMRGIMEFLSCLIWPMGEFGDQVDRSSVEWTDDTS